MRAPQGAPGFEWFMVHQQERDNSFWQQQLDRDDSFRQQQLDLQRQQLEQQRQHQERMLNMQEQQLAHQQRIDLERVRIDSEIAATNRQNSDANNRNANANERNAAAIESLVQLLVQNGQGQAQAGLDDQAQVPPVGQASNSQQGQVSLNNRAQVPSERQASSSRNGHQQTMAQPPNQNDPPAYHLVTSTRDYDIFESADGSRHIYKSRTSNESFEALKLKSDSARSLGCTFCKSTTTGGPCQNHCLDCAALGQGIKCPLHGGH